VNALRAIEAGLVEIGYSRRAIIRNYTFADVLSAQGTLRSVSLAAFTQTPESYRSAAFGVVMAGNEVEAAVLAHRALGAPLMLSVDTVGVRVWQVSAYERPALLEHVDLDALPNLFRRNAKFWSPKSVHRAKSRGQIRHEYQLDFVDLGLLPAIEREVHSKLDRLLEQVVALLIPDTNGTFEEAAFRTTFRLLAAKVLQDRSHSLAESWDSSDVVSVLDGIEAFYKLPRMRSDHVQLSAHDIENAWSRLMGAISFRNISSDNLAFVYENTLVTADTRKRFGTHSTPRQVAEYILDRIDLSRFDLDSIKIYEPYAGAGVFLVSALRHLRDLLPTEWSDKKRHHFMTSRLGGTGIDLFACEVAILSLILADYPNANGWNIPSEDLFGKDNLSRNLANATVVLCNPPFEKFDTEGREAYPEMVARTVSKPMAVLHTVLDEHPDALGFVLPHGVPHQKQYAKLRTRIASLYGEVELVSLPDRIFTQAGFESSLLIATEPRTSTRTPMVLASTVVDDAGRTEFLESGKTTLSRRRTKVVTDDRLWIGELDEIFEYLNNALRLGSVTNIHRGLQWKGQKKDGVSSEPQNGFRPGIYKPKSSLAPFWIHGSEYLNFDPNKAYRPAPFARPWDQPKVFANNQRLGRGHWRIAAAYDESGLSASQQFFGIWPTRADFPGVAIEAILNGPLANAFLVENASGHHFTNELLAKLPIPNTLDTKRIGTLVGRYRNALGKLGALEQVDDATLNRHLIAIDAEVLRAYDLPPRLERQLLEYFRGYKRPVSHGFTEWIPETFTACIPLHEYIAGEYLKNAGPWVLDVFTPAPVEETDALSEFID
jgi:type I restriction-modification system DNA methylase subunit